jgi:hypothetical protein
MEKFMDKRKIIWGLITMLIWGVITPTLVQAKELYAFTKESIPCYSDDEGSSRAGSISRYHGFKVEEKSGSYYRVTYKKNGKKKTAWIAKSDYDDWALEYDGSEIPVVASGTYSMGGQNVQITFLGNKQYQILLEEKNEYLTVSGNRSSATLTFTDSEEEGSLWTMKRVEHNLLIQNKKTGLYLLPKGSAIDLVSYEDASSYSWILIRQDKNVDTYRDFLQYDGRWGGKKYGNSTRMAQAACGVLAVVNSAFSLNGQFIDPMEAAQYACDYGYRIENNGTDEGYFKAFGKNVASKYGFCYAGEAESIASIRECLKNGGVVAAHVPGHYLCIADYDEAKKKYLVLDSHPLPKRATSPFGSWVSESRLGTGSLMVSTSYMYTRVEDTGFHWDLEMQKVSVLQDISVNLSPDASENILEELYQKEGK